MPFSLRPCPSVSRGIKACILVLILRSAILKDGFNSETCNFKGKRLEASAVWSVTIPASRMLLFRALFFHSQYSCEYIYNKIELKICHFKHFWVYSSVALSRFTLSCNHPSHSSPDFFSSCRTETLYRQYHSPVPCLLLGLAPTAVLSVS